MCVVSERMTTQRINLNAHSTNTKPGCAILRQVTDFVADRPQNSNFLGVLEEFPGFALRGRRGKKMCD